MKKMISVSWLVLALAALPAFGDFESGSDGSDGALVITTNTVINLDLAASAPGLTWDTPSPVAGEGVYDSLQWAVVFKYTTIDIAPGATVTFLNHRSGAPVVWLATGDITIGGTVNLNGGSGTFWGLIPSQFSKPGPGGFGGGQNGLSSIAGFSGGFGPGGGQRVGGNSQGGAYGGPACNGNNSSYGNGQVFPLIGGSGGGAVSNGHGSGAGAGAILIATSTRITLTGAIFADGGTAPSGYGGSGGAIRLIARDAILGSGTLRAREGGCASVGRIRLESLEATIPFNDPIYSWSTNRGPVFPEPTTKPTLRITHVDALVMPEEPDAGIRTVEGVIDVTAPSIVQIQAVNIPAGTTVSVRAVPDRGEVVTATSTPLVDSGGGVLTATATITIPPGSTTEIQLRANWN